MSQAESFEIVTYTAAQIKDWIEGGGGESLLPCIISRCRARAVAANPYTRAEDPLVAAVKIAGSHRAVAYTAAFPELLGGERYWWFSTLWCDREYRGLGLPLAAVGSLAEIYGPDHCLDTMGASETVEIFKYLGHSTTHFDEYRFGRKPDKHSTLGKLLSLKERIVADVRPLCPSARRLSNIGGYTLEYCNRVDNPTYAFIKQHTGADLFVREQPIFDWILNYPFKHRTPLMQRVTDGGLFGDADQRYWISGVKVMVGSTLVGFYIIRDSDSDLSVKYLYYDDNHSAEVFASIAQHILALRNPCFTTRCAPLAQYIGRMGLFSKQTVNHISFSYPGGFHLPEDYTTQAGDGDCFV